MAIRNLHGHGVSSAAPAHHQQVQPANLNLNVNPGATDYMGVKGGSGGNFPARASGKGRAQSPAQQSPPNSMTA